MISTRKKIANKRASEEVLEQVIFITLNLIFFLTLLFFVYRTASSDANIEEAYAKKFALMIDSVKPNTEVRISLNYLYDLAKNNDYSGRVLDFNMSKGELTVKVRSDGGKSFIYFTSPKDITLLEQYKTLVIKG